MTDLSKEESPQLQDVQRETDIEMLDDYTINVSPRLRRLPPYLFGTLNKMKYQKRQEGIDIIDLGMGNPNDPTPQPVVDKLCEAVQDRRNQRYSVSTGVFNLRREMAKRYKKIWEVDIDPEDEIIACIGSKEGFSHMCMALLGPGDSALVPSPAFPIHVYAVALAEGNVINVPIADEEQMLVHIVYVCENLFPKPKVLVLNYPHNPTTTTVELEFFKRVVELAKRFGFLVIHDFAYGETTFDGYKAPSMLQVPGAKDVGVEFTTMSKQFNMAGWRIGFCAGNSEMIRGLAKIKGYYDYGIFQPIQIAAIIALRNCDDTVAEMKATYQGRRDVLCDGLTRIGWPVEKPRASVFTWARIPEPFRAMGSIKFAMKLMDEAEVAAAPGRGFGEGGEGFMRFALVENEKRLRQAVRQIGRALKLKS